MTQNATTESRKIDALISRAKMAGLDVTVEIKDETWVGDVVMRTISLEVRRPRVEENNLLDQLRNAEHISASWIWVRENGRTPKMCFARQYGLFGSGRDIAAKVLPYSIAGMGHTS